MRYLNRLLCAGAVATALGATASPAVAQQGNIITGGGQTTGSLGGTGGLAGGLGGGGLGGGQGGGLGGSQLGGIALQSMATAPTITAPGTTGGGGASGLNASNFLSAYYANPYYQGTLANSMSNAAPGGFGQPLYGNTGGATGTGGGMRTTPTGVRTGGTTGAATTGIGGGGGTGTRTGGIGGAGGRTGGVGGIGGVNSNYGVVVPLQVQITYPAVARFPSTPVAAPQLQADLTGMLARSTGAIANPAGVQVLTGEGNAVILRGSVRDAEEARLIEGMTRLTPGVGLIKNELTFPAPTPAFPGRP